MSKGFPWQLGVAVVVWAALGALLVISALTGSMSSEGPDQASIDAIRNNLGDTAVATSASSHPTLLLLCGLMMLLMAVLLLLGQGWARYVLGVLGILAMVLLALDSRWEAIIAFAVLVLGTISLLAPSTHRYLAGR
ncbi:MAG: hypothetical protein J2P19_09115 [Pseudonocardia sp.]|nr:hypothetical protein [Pseudonocardia sp.]